MAAPPQVDTIFLGFNHALEQDANIREDIRKHVKELELHVRKITTLLQQIHIAETCAKARAALPAVVAVLNQLQSMIPRQDYYKFNDHWKNSIQQLIFVVALIVWLESEKLATPPEIETLLGVSRTASPNGFGIELEDYLVGLTSLPSELARLCVNSVIAENYTMPAHIQRFVSDLYSGFRLLNLKNDFLRKRYDSIKYDLKKIEEVVYDISIRKLAQAHAPVLTPAAVAPAQMQS